VTTRSEIRSWLERAKREGATHMIVACDTFSYEDYPISVLPGTNPHDVALGLGEMQRLMECYAMHLPLEAQVQEERARHFEAAPARVAVSVDVPRGRSRAVAAEVADDLWREADRIARERGAMGSPEWAERYPVTPAGTARLMHDIQDEHRRRLDACLLAPKGWRPPDAR
jgi:type II secretory pathway component PulL